MAMPPTGMMHQCKDALASPEKHLDGKNMTRILLVEDSVTQAFQIKTKLLDEGFEVLLVGDGQQALDAIPDFRPHLILTDMEMPVLNGLELIVRTRKQHPTIPLILITANGTDEIAIEAMEKGAAAYLPKSMLHEKLFETINEVLDVMETASSYSKLIESMDSCEFKFTIANDVDTIRPLVDLVIQMAAGVSLFDETECVRMGLAIDHALRNAIYHGNLELSTSELESDGELEIEGESNLPQRRATDSPYVDRQVHVTIHLCPREAKILIRDEGSGFDLSTIPSKDEMDKLDPERGRGLVMIHSIMDEVHFNECGNEITVVKRCALAT